MFRKKMIPLLLLLSLLCSGCAGKAPAKEVFQVTWLDVFDTVTNLRGYAYSQEDFNDTAEKVHAALVEYHQLFDVYHTYSGIANLKTVNSCAGAEPVTVDARILALLRDCRSYYELTGGRVNVAMGSVLTQWHTARNEGISNPAVAELPSMDALKEGAKHCSFDTVILDEENSTVFLSDELQQLDVGAVAKGWSAQRMAELLPNGYLLNLGGNVVSSGPKPDGSPWVIGIQDPRAQDYLLTVNLYTGSTVTSGDYQRYYTVNGKNYHHIIDPDTLMPSRYWQSVSILCEDSGLADCLSTALFLMPLEEGKALAKQCGVEAMWVGENSAIEQTEGFAEHIHE